MLNQQKNWKLHHYVADAIMFWEIGKPRAVNKRSQSLAW